MERPCVRLSFPSLGGFWGPNLTSWRSFAVRLRFFVNFNFRVFQRAFVLARRHRPNSGFPCAVRMELAVCSWNSKGSSQLLDLPFQFLIQRSTCQLRILPVSSENHEITEAGLCGPSPRQRDHAGPGNRLSILDQFALDATTDQPPTPPE